MKAGEYEPLSEYGETDFDQEDIQLVRDEFGRPALVPRSLRNLDPERRALVTGLMEAAESVRLAQDEVEQLVERCRLEGLSWEAIGWAVGTTGNAARQRWGGRPGEDP